MYMQKTLKIELKHYLKSVRFVGLRYITLSQYMMQKHKISINNLINTILCLGATIDLIINNVLQNRLKPISEKITFLYVEVICSVT